MHTFVARSPLVAGMVAVFAWFIAPVPTQAFSVTNTFDKYVGRTVTVGSQRFRVDLVEINLANPRLEARTIAATTKTSCYEQACPVKALKSFLDRTSGVAAINGTYFCPAEYPACASTPGNFYWTLFNARNRKFINGDQNRYNAGAMFTMMSDRSWKFYRQTGDVKFLPDLNPKTATDPVPSNLTAAISNGPALIDQGQNVLDTNTLDTKQRTVKSNRSGLGVKGNKLYLMVARAATVTDLGKIMQSLKMDYGLNLDGGGSSALWYRGSYKVGPGRNIPNALVFRER